MRCLSLFCAALLTGALLSGCGNSSKNAFEQASGEA